ncbi:hypothetical protein DM44_3151 [Burkholderia cepacia]|nr:hypothetical protein DM42_3353 [Burkholderia cepacia]KGB95861.1 hypothetical protein DM44_3151 [Burkholderia cepacia]
MTRGNQCFFTLRRGRGRLLAAGVCLERICETENSVRFIDRLPRVIQKVTGISKQRRLMFQCVVVARIIRSFTNCFEKRTRKNKALESCGELWRAVVWKWGKCVDLIKRDRSNPIKRFDVGLDRFIGDLRFTAFDKLEGNICSSANDLESLGDSCGCQFRSIQVVISFLLILSNCKRESDDYGRARTNCHDTVDDHARGVDVHPFRCARPFEQARDEVRRQTSCSKRQQRYSSVLDRGAQGIPVLHIFPGIDFRAIVARSTEGA